ncbi:MAG: hypothetical protein ACKOXO_01805 [Cyanobium sp.]
MAPRVLLLVVLLFVQPLGFPAASALARSRPAAVHESEPSPAAPLEAPAICLLTPAASADAAGRVRALVPVDRPTIFARGDFAEIRLMRRGHPLWRLQADPGGSLQGPLAWPLPPLTAGETVLLRLRPLGVAPEAFADVQLIAADASTLAASTQLRQRLGRDATAWLQAVLRELEASHTELAMALLFDFDGPSSPSLDALRLEIHDRACASPILSPASAVP